MTTTAPLFAPAGPAEESTRLPEGPAELGVDLWEHVGRVLDAMAGIAPDLGLDGRLARPTV